MKWLGEELILRNGWELPEHSELWTYLLRSVGRGQAEAMRRYRQDLNGEPRVIVDHTFGPEQYRLDAERRQQRNGSRSASFWSLFDGYAAESKPAPATVKAWKRQIAAFITFVGTEDASKIKFSDVLAWKEHLLAKVKPDGTTLSSKTVRDTYLAAIKTVFKWGVENDRLPANPAEQVRVRGGRKVRLRDPDFTDDEAKAILKATLSQPPAGLSIERARARRWVPWICAYTGARVAEITQLRSQDVSNELGIWTIRITPEAGSVKGRKARTVAIHPHLIEQGFLEAIAGLEGPIFYDPSRRRAGSSDAHPQCKKVGQYLAEWVRREVGVSDPNVAPNHGWRHRFKTQARSVAMDPETRDYIQGHVPRTEGEGYGGLPAPVTLREIKKLPAYRWRRNEQ